MGTSVPAASSSVKAACAVRRSPRGTRSGSRASAASNPARAARAAGVSTRARAARSPSATTCANSIASDRGGAAQTHHDALAPGAPGSCVTRCTPAWVPSRNRCDTNPSAVRVVRGGPRLAAIRASPSGPTAAACEARNHSPFSNRASATSFVTCSPPERQNWRNTKSEKCVAATCQICSCSSTESPSPRRSRSARSGSLKVINRQTGGSSEPSNSTNHWYTPWFSVNTGANRVPAWASLRQARSNHASRSSSVSGSSYV